MTLSEMKRVRGIILRSPLLHLFTICIPSFPRQRVHRHGPEFTYSIAYSPVKVIIVHGFGLESDMVFFFFKPRFAVVINDIDANLMCYNTVFIVITSRCSH